MQPNIKIPTSEKWLILVGKNFKKQKKNYNVGKNSVENSIVLEKNYWMT